MNLNKNLDANLSANNNSEKQIYVTFFLSESEFSLSVDHVQEVVNTPEKYTVVPLAPYFLKGLFNLRGSIIPVIDLSNLLKLSSNSKTEFQKIAIVQVNGSLLGLLFDRTGEVFKENINEKSVFENTSELSIISGVFKKDNGNRLIQILNLKNLFNLQNIPKDKIENQNNQKLNENKRRGHKKQSISFVVGSSRCALAISSIQEIIKIDQLTNSALGGGYCVGTFDLRGITVPIIDFAALLKFREVNRNDFYLNKDFRIIVMRLNSDYFGLLVDAVDSIVSYFDDELLFFPLLEQERFEMFLGCISGNDKIEILLLDHQKILTHNEISDITHGHSSLYQDTVDKKNEIQLENSQRVTYISFKIENLYAIAIKDIKEIIDLPNEILQLPGFNNHVKGMFNLRGDLITIIDSRCLYKLPYLPQENNKNQKVLIFKINENLFGVIVDSIEAILTFSNKQKIKLPKQLINQNKFSIVNDVSDAAQVKDLNGVEMNLMIIDANSLVTSALQNNLVA